MFIQGGRQISPTAAVPYAGTAAATPDEITGRSTW